MILGDGERAPRRRDRVVVVLHQDLGALEQRVAQPRVGIGAECLEDLDGARARDQGLVELACARERHREIATRATGARRPLALAELGQAYRLADRDMGAVSRRAEHASLAQALAPYRALRYIEDPATLEGGDVMRIGKTLYAGYSRRTNVAGIQQLSALVHPLGYFVVPVEVRGCLHLKTACCYIGDDTVLANRAWMDPDALCGLKILDVPEPRGANALRIGGTVVMPSAFPRTREMLDNSGFRVRTIDNSELLKAEAGVTCTSLIFEAA